MLLSIGCPPSLTRMNKPIIVGKLYLPCSLTYEPCNVFLISTLFTVDLQNHCDWSLPPDGYLQEEVSFGYKHASRSE